MQNRAEHVRLFSKWISWESEYTNTQALKSNITFQSECDIILSYILEVFLQSVMQMLPSPGLAEAGVGVDHLSEEDPSLHQGLGQGPGVGHVHVSVLCAVSHQQRVVTKIFHVSVGHENV